MTLSPSQLLTARYHYLPLLGRLQALFNEMDQAYAAVAKRYGFRCNGCEDNCCLTRFYHHTLLEYLFLAEGIRTLDAGARRAIHVQALAVSAKTADAGHQNNILRIMCPLNQDGRCRVYRYRPMICRLHGLPHELRRPGGQVIRHPGCDRFFEQCRERGKTDYVRFDRTLFYRQMAVLEKELRLQTGYVEKIKLTIAQMLATIAGNTNEID
jgi:Fe-S-cluster containining protein